MRNAQPRIITTMIDETTAAAEVRTWIGHLDNIAAAAAGARLRGVLSGISDAVATEQTIEYTGVEVPRPAAPGPTPAAHQALLVFSTSEPGSYATISIPGVRPELLLATGPGAGVLLDPAAPALVALAALLVGGSYTNPFGVTLTQLETAYMQILP